MTIAAVCGVGFGIYGIINNNSIKASLSAKDAEVENLKAKIKELNSEIDELELSSGATFEYSS